MLTRLALAGAFCLGGLVALLLPGFPTVDAQITAGLGRRPVSTTKVAGYLLTTTDAVVPCDATAAGGDLTMDLPTAVSIGGVTYTVKNVGTVNNCLVDPNLAETIDGNLTAAITPGDALTFVSDGTGWQSIEALGVTIPTLLQGDLIYASAGNTLDALAKSATATRYLSNTGGSNNPAWAQINLPDGVTGILPCASGGAVYGGITTGITASVTQTQGQGALTTAVNEVATVANVNDTVTLPAAAPCARVTILNNGANTLRIYPASGDDLGSGVNTPTGLNTTNNVVYLAYDATNWEVEQ